MAPAVSAGAAYAALAPHYDALTAGHDYDAWTGALEELAREHGLRGRRLLDVACGTGKSFLPFLARGYEVSACDLSPEMLAVARRKAGGRARIFRADMRALPATAPVELVICLDDALNYLLDPDDLASAFASARRCLEPGGLYVFDVNTLGAYRSVFATDSWSEAGGELFVWRGRSGRELAPGTVAHATIEIFAPAGRDRWQRLTSEHHQRHHTDAEIRSALRAAGLRCVAVRGLTPDGTLHRRVAELRHTKRIYLATPAKAVRTLKGGE